jgi:hypothetical protein
LPLEVKSGLVPFRKLRKTRHLMHEPAQRKRFPGPVFIVGLPRSGTKLLRDLLNENPAIGIPVAETHVIPTLVKRFGDPPRLADDASLRRFHVELTQTAFCWHMKRFGVVMPFEHLEKTADRSSWTGIFEAILRYFAPARREDGFLWGDKSPSYLTKMDVLKRIFPAARFLHILRDPRDCSLSAKKAWGKSVYRAAEAWRDGVKTSRRMGASLGADYKEIYFEALLDDPSKALAEVCTFLERDFVPAMTELKRAGENLGDAKGQARILRENRGKYEGHLPAKQVKRIEEIVFPALEGLPYKAQHATGFRPLGPLERLVLRAHDKVQRLRFDLTSKGVLEGLRFHYRLKW